MDNCCFCFKFRCVMLGPWRWVKADKVGEANMQNTVSRAKSVKQRAKSKDKDTALINKAKAGDVETRRFKVAKGDKAKISYQKTTKPKRSMRAIPDPGHWQHSKATKRETQSQGAGCQSQPR